MTLKIAKQYVKDLSLKVPNAPEVFVNNQDKPDIEISIDIDAKKISDLAYEVTLKIKASANHGNLFEVSVDYGAIIAFEVDGEEKNLERTLLVDCPTLLFPFSRNIISNLVSDAGFSPLMLDPIDFERLYHKREESVTIN